MPHTQTPTPPASLNFSHILQQWYARHARTLPWRGTSDAYHIWLSEVILQQTRVEQGRAYYERFTHLFPTIEALATASEQEVLTAWQGLGYYSRARNLHKTARLIAQSGHFPNDFTTLRTLPGIGDYTAAAIASLAYNLPHAVVDGNVYRVLSRIYGIDTPIDTNDGRRVFKDLAHQLLDTQHSATHNQALMDFGATVCTPRAPHCHECPFHTHCAVIADGRDAEDLPKKAHRQNVTQRHFAYVFIYYNNSLLLHQRGAGDIWHGLFEPLLFETAQPLAATQVFKQTCDTLQLSPEEGTFQQIAEQMRHQLTHRLILTDAFRLHLTHTAPLLPKGYTWVNTDKLHEYPLPRLITRILEQHNRKKNDNQKIT